MERRLVEWLFAPGPWGITAVLFFSALVVSLLPLPDDGKVEAMRRVLAALAVLHFFMMRSVILMCLLEWLLSAFSFIPQYFLSVAIFAFACHALIGAALDSVWLRFGARIAGALYVWAGLDLVRAYSDGDTSALKTFWLSWLMTPPLVRRLLARRARRRLEALRAK